MSEEKIILELRELKTQVEQSILCRKEILPLDEAAKYLGISKSTLYKINLTKPGIPYSKPAHKMIYYKRADLDAWMLQNYSTNVVSDVHVTPRKRRESKINP